MSGTVDCAYLELYEAGWTLDYLVQRDGVMRPYAVMPKIVATAPWAMSLRRCGPPWTTSTEGTSSVRCCHQMDTHRGEFVLPRPDKCEASSSRAHKRGGAQFLPLGRGLKTASQRPLWAESIPGQDPRERSRMVGRTVRAQSTSAFAFRMGARAERAYPSVDFDAPDRLKRNRDKDREIKRRRVPSRSAVPASA